ncbi:hypothetical protein JW752_04120 [Candidatus Peregrinibacteria bacterium]|nr:hypothetical protein [Candidatus Peregrinibacteria bacterium]
MHKKRLKENIKLMAIAIMALLSLGTVAFSILEGWNLVDSFYFVAMTATTVGYGDFTPTHTLSKIITVFYSLMIIPIILYGFSVLAKYEVERVYRKIGGLERQQQEQEDEIEKTERRIQEQKRLIKEQQEILKKQESQLKKQTKINKEQEEELEGHQRKIKKQEKEIKEHDEELEVVEDVVEDVVEETLAKKAK